VACWEYLIIRFILLIFFEGNSIIISAYLMFFTRYPFNNFY